MRNKLPHIILTLLGALLFTGCYTYRYVPDGSHLLYNTVQTVEMADSSGVTNEVRDALKKSGDYYVQRRNSKLFGIKKMPVGLWLYGIASPKDHTIWGNYWRRLGQAPVIYDENKAAQTAQQLQKLMESKGCFSASTQRAGHGASCSRHTSRSTRWQ